MPIKVPTPSRKLSETPTYMSIVHSPENSASSLSMPSFYEQWKRYQAIEAVQQKRILILVALLVASVVLAMVFFGI